MFKKMNCYYSFRCPEEWKLQLASSDIEKVIDRDVVIITDIDMDIQILIGKSL